MNNKTLFSSKSIEWYTPPDLLQQIEQFMGGIDLDPARPGLENGLAMIWRGRVFLNPPYGRHIKQWIDRAMSDPVDEIILLIPVRTESRWFQALWAHTICFIRGRLHFCNSKHSAPFASALVYRGPRAEEFRSAFSHLGYVTMGAGEQMIPYQLPLLAVA